MLSPFRFVLVLVLVVVLDSFAVVGLAVLSRPPSS
jgi:hypothetical protein